jgi:hypothetical protein
MEGAQHGGGVVTVRMGGRSHCTSQSANTIAQVRI